MDEFIQQLRAILGDHNLLLFLKEFTTAMPKTELPCRHQVLRPVGETPCFAAGTADLGKAMSIRKNTILTAAYKRAKKEGKVPSTSTKIRVHHLFMLAASATTQELLEHTARLEGQDYVLQHLCGHGICTVRRPTACVNPEHMRWGTQADNVKHVGAHEVLELAHTAEEYVFLIDLYQRNPVFSGLF